jgi:hypothetical protein
VLIGKAIYSIIVARPIARIISPLHHKWNMKEKLLPADMGHLGILLRDDMLR